MPEVKPEAARGCGPNGSGKDGARGGPSVSAGAGAGNAAAKPNQNEKIRQIHMKLNEGAENYEKIIRAIGEGSGVAGQRSATNDEAEEEEEESEEDFIDYQILNKLRFQQSAERKQWQGVNVTYSGIPGTSTLNQNERVLMFKEERAEMDA